MRLLIGWVTRISCESLTSSPDRFWFLGFIQSTLQTSRLCEAKHLGDGHIYYEGQPFSYVGFEGRKKLWMDCWEQPGVINSFIRGKRPDTTLNESYLPSAFQPPNKSVLHKAENRLFHFHGQKAGYICISILWLARRLHFQVLQTIYSLHDVSQTGLSLNLAK